MIAIPLFVAIFLANTFNFITSQVRSEFTYSLEDGYPIRGDRSLGNIVGVDVDNDNNVILFHRGSHIWDLSTFDSDEIYRPSRDSPIPEETVVTIDPKGKVIQTWGQNLFFMPHGLSLDLDGTRFIPGSDENHFCKPTSVADTGNFVFVADGYCNSRIAMFSSHGKYLGEFGQSNDAAYISRSSLQPTFSIPHKITYLKDKSMLCVADRQNGRIQCFSFEEPVQDSRTQADSGLILNGAIKLKFIIADPRFNGRLFSLDYSPLKGGLIVAVSGESLSGKPPLGFVYNVTTKQLISQFSPPSGQIFGMAHDIALAGDEANMLYVVDVSPINLWKFTRSVAIRENFQPAETNKAVSGKLNEALSIMRPGEHNLGFLWYLLILSIIITILIVITRTKRLGRHNASHSFASLYANSYPATLNSLFANSRFPRRTGSNGSRAILTTMFSRRPFFNLFDRTHQQNDFSRIPLEDSDNTDDDKSDSDVEEFNINQASQSIKIDV